MLSKAQRQALNDFADKWDRDTAWPSETLAKMSNDWQRYQFCRMKVDGYRNAWFRGQRNSVLQVLRSTEEQYDHMSAERRVSTGESRWSKSLESKDLAGAEQMYARWAMLYLAASAETRARNPQRP